MAMSEQRLSRLQRWILGAALADKRISGGELLSSIPRKYDTSNVGDKVIDLGGPGPTADIPGGCPDGAIHRPLLLEGVDLDQGVRMGRGKAIVCLKSI
jgi:hypothetical protein